MTLRKTLPQLLLAGVLAVAACFSLPDTGQAARLNITGFESGNIGTYELVTNSGTAAVQSTTKRSGTYGLQVNPVTSALGWVRVGGYGADGQSNSNVNVATLWVRFYFYITTVPASGEEYVFAARTSGGNNKLYLRLTSTGTLKAYNNSDVLLGTSAALSTSTWYRIELKIGTGATAASEMLIDGTNVFTSASSNLHTSNNGHQVFGKILDTGSQSIEVYYDDISTDDADYPGVGQVRVLLPTANGSTMQWTGGTGSSNYVEVASLPPVTASYVKSTTTNDVALFTMGKLSSVGAGSGNVVIPAVKAIIVPRLDTAGTDGTKLRVKSGATTTDLTSVVLTTSAIPLSSVLATDPNTSATWTPSAVNVLECGAIETTAVLTRITEVYLMVEFTVTTTNQSMLLRGM